MHRFPQMAILFAALGVMHLGFSSPAMAFSCDSETTAAEKNIVAIRAELDGLPQDKIDRIERFLVDGEKMSQSARRKCDSALNSWDRIQASADAVIAQANIAAAKMLLKEAQH